MVRIALPFVGAAVLASQVLAAPVPKAQDAGVAGWEQQQQWQESWGEPPKNEWEQPQHAPPAEQHAPPPAAHEQPPPKHEEPPKHEQPWQEPPRHDAPPPAAHEQPPKHEEPPKHEQPWQEPPKHEEPPAKNEEPPKHEQPAVYEPPKNQHEPPKNEHEVPPAQNEHEVPEWPEAEEQEYPPEHPSYTEPEHPSPTQAQEHEEAPPAGATHVVYVGAPGYMGYTPFSVNATVGDVVEFRWLSGPHTVSKSTLNNICARIEDDTFFTSGRQEPGAVFQKVVNDTRPTWLYNNVEDLCENQGFWGVINAPANGGANETVANKLREWTELYPELGQTWEYVREVGKDTEYINWGNSIDCSEIPEEYHYQLARQVMETRYFYSVNRGVLENGVREDGKEIEYPDLQAAVASTSETGAGDSSAPAAPENAGEGTSSGSTAPAEDDTTAADSAGFTVRPTHIAAVAFAVLGSFML